MTQSTQLDDRISTGVSGLDQVLGGGFLYCFCGGINGVRLDLNQWGQTRLIWGINGVRLD